MKILAAEDEANLQELLKVHLESERWEVDFTTNGEDTLAKFEENNYDVVILDWMLDGEMTGLDVCKKLAGRAPILMLTSRTSPVDVVRALDNGADDFISKPYDEHILVARIRAIARRGPTEKEGSPDVFEIGGLKVFVEKFEVMVDGSPVELTTSEFKLLVAMLKGRGKVLSRSSLVKQIQDGGVTVVERIVDTHVYAIRKKLGEAVSFIESVRGIGYRIKE